MKSDKKFNLTKRLPLPAAIAVLVASGIAHTQILAIDLFAGGDPGRYVRSLNTPANQLTAGFARQANGTRDALKFTLGGILVAPPQVLQACDTRVTQGGWGYTDPTSIPSLPSGKATFGGNASSDADGFVTDGQEQFADRNADQPFEFHSVIVTSVICTSDTHAVIEGQGEVRNLLSFPDLQENFRIDIDDFGEPGVGQDKYQIQLFGAFVYDSGEITLLGGNVQIR
jgi:hypothetical protein